MKKLLATIIIAASVFENSASQSEETAPLLVLSYWCSKEQYSIHVRGEVRNVSSEPLENVVVLAILRQANGTLVKTADSFLEYKPLMPGQASPFHVSTTDNPLISECSELAFKKFAGPVIPHIVDKKAVKPKPIR